MILLISRELHCPDRASCQLSYSTYAISYAAWYRVRSFGFFNMGEITIGDNFPMIQDFLFPALCPPALSQGFFQAFPIKAVLWVTSLVDFMQNFLMVVHLSSFPSISHTHLPFLKSDSHVTPYSLNAIPCMCNELGK